jgi:UDP-N-acetylmuramyl pentapeptide synthase
MRVLAGMEDSTSRVLVMGDMNELGEGSRDLHRDLGRDLAQAGLRRLILVGSEVQATHEGALAAGMDPACVCYFADLEQARIGLPAQLRPGDTVLFKGSRGARLDQLLSDLHAARGAAQLAQA